MKFMFSLVLCLLAITGQSGFAMEHLKVPYSMMKKTCRYLIVDVRDYAESSDELKDCMTSCLRGHFEMVNGFAGPTVFFHGKLIPDSQDEHCSVTFVNGQPVQGDCRL